MKKVKIEIPIISSAMLPNGSKLLCVENGWVTWYRRDGWLIEISTCSTNDFSSQNNTETIFLTNYEFRLLSRALKIK